MEPASDGTLRNKHNEMAAVCQEEDSQRSANEKKEDKRFEQFRKSKLDNFEGSMKKVEKECQVQFAAPMAALTEKHHLEIVGLENDHREQLQRERVKLQSYRTMAHQRARLEKMLEEQWQQHLRVTAQGQKNLNGKRDIKDHSIGNRMITNTQTDVAPGKLVQQQSPSRLLLATPPIQVLNIPTTIILLLLWNPPKNDRGSRRPKIF